jgi:hypothetical protein
MKTYTTRIDTLDGKRWSGDYVQADSKRQAQAILDRTGRGYMKVDAVLIATIDYDTGLQIDYDNLN